MKPRRPEVAAPLVDFTALYEHHATHVHRFALYLSGDPALADDLTSEAFVRVWTARERVEISTVRAYLFAIVRNLFLEVRRRDRRHAPLDERIPSTVPGPEDLANGHSQLRTVLTALSALPEVDRAALLMRADEALPYEDIANVLGISIGAAKVKVHRARLRLAETLQATPHREKRS